MPHFLPSAVASEYGPFGYGFQSALFAYIAYTGVRVNGLKSWPKSFLMIAGVSAFLSVVVLGTHSEDDDPDPSSVTVTKVVTDSTPTPQERATVFVNDVAVMLLGAYMGTIARSQEQP